MEVANLSGGTPQGVQEGRVDHIEGGLDDLCRHEERLRRNAVEALAVLAHGNVPTLGHVVDDSDGGIGHVLGQGALAPEVSLRETPTTRKLNRSHGYSSPLATTSASFFDSSRMRTSVR